MNESLRRDREAIVREHMDAENRLDFDAALATFKHPRYELIGLGREYDGAEEVTEYFRTSRIPFPDQYNEIIAMHHAEDAVVVEFWLMGTHLGDLGRADAAEPGTAERGSHGGGIAPTGKKFRERMCAFFVFEGDGLVNERVYFNPGSILEQLT